MLPSSSSEIWPKSPNEPLHGGCLVIKDVAQALVRGALGEVESKHAHRRGRLLGNDLQGLGVSRDNPYLVEWAARPTVKLSDKLAPNPRRRSRNHCNVGHLALPMTIPCLHLAW